MSTASHSLAPLRAAVLALAAAMALLLVEGCASRSDVSLGRRLLDIARDSQKPVPMLWPDHHERPAKFGARTNIERN